MHLSIESGNKIETLEIWLVLYVHTVGEQLIHLSGWLKTNVTHPFMGVP